MLNREANRRESCSLFQPPQHIYNNYNLKIARIETQKDILTNKTYHSTNANNNKDNQEIY